MKRLLIDIGMATLDVTVTDDTDLDDRFEARCNDTGETLLINGWLIDSTEEIGDTLEEIVAVADLIRATPICAWGMGA